jgi:hypothetical protein
MKIVKNKLISFIHQWMNITHPIKFRNVHRFGKRPSPENNPPRSIVARFLYYNEARTCLRGKPFEINEQFPMEIEQRRKTDKIQKWFF